MWDSNFVGLSIIMWELGEHLSEFCDWEGEGVRPKSFVFAARGLQGMYLEKMCLASVYITNSKFLVHIVAIVAWPLNFQ